MAAAAQDAARREVEGWPAGLDALHARIARRFRRAAVRQRARRSRAGLRERVERKNGWPLAEPLGEPGPQGLQRLLNAADWDVAAVRDDLRAYVVEHLGDPAGVRVVDETGFLKKGTTSVGVQRQASGPAGRIANCQVGGGLADASPAGRAFLDRELDLPKAWADDAARRREAGVPPEVACATKPQLAQAMLARAFAAGVPAAWVTGDEGYGDDGAFRRWLEDAAGRPSGLAGAGDHPGWPAGAQERAARLVAALPQAAWAPRSAGAASQGERLSDWACLRLPYAGAPGTAHWLRARRRLSDPTEIASYRAFGPPATPVAALARGAGRRWAIEAGVADAKGTVGRDHSEGRRWTAWSRHVTLALLAHASREVTRRRAAAAATATATEAGTKGDPPPCSR